MPNHLLGFLFLVICGTAFGEEKLAKPSNCYIHITSTFKTGKVKKSSKAFHYPTKEKCEAMRVLYSENFSPSEIDKVVTKMEWKKRH